MKIGITSGVYLNFPIAEAVVRVARAGYNGIDVWSGRPHIYRDDFTKDDLNDLNRVLSDHDLEVSSFMPAFYRYPYDLSSPNLRIRQDSLTYMYQCIDSAAILNAGLVLIVPKQALFGQSIEDARARLTDCIADVCQYAQQYALMMGIEPANIAATNLINTSTDALQIIHSLNLKNLGVVLDTGHLNITKENVSEAVSGLGEKLLQVHLNDNDGVEQQNLVPGEGTFDFRALISILKEKEFDGYLSAELGFHYTLDPDDAVNQTAQRMKEMIR